MMMMRKSRRTEKKWRTTKMSWRRMRVRRRGLRRRTRRSRTTRRRRNIMHETAKLIFYFTENQQVTTVSLSPTC